jgi:hypothetical protein
MLDPSFHYALDSEFFMRAFANFKAISLPDCLASMRLHDTSKSVATGLGFAPEVMRVAEKIIANPQTYPSSKIVPAKVLAGAHVFSAGFCYVQGAYRAAFGHLLASARVSPAFWRLIAGRELPRIAVRILVGNRRYWQLSAWYRRRWSRTLGLGNGRRA